jgi:hypothetical protein
LEPFTFDDLVYVSWLTGQHYLYPLTTNEECFAAWTYRVPKEEKEALARAIQRALDLVPYLGTTDQLYLPTYPPKSKDE